MEEGRLHIEDLPQEGEVRTPDQSLCLNTFPFHHSLCYAVMENKKWLYFY